MIHIVSIALHARTITKHTDWCGPDNTVHCTVRGSVSRPRKNSTVCRNSFNEFDSHFVPFPRSNSHSNYCSRSWTTPRPSHGIHIGKWETGIHIPFTGCRYL